ncbi:MAG: AmmeMemoRadiSam system protein A [Chloroflexota bacterium]
MSGIVIGALSPHPPIVIPEVGKGEEAKAGRTIAALKEMARRVVAAKPDVTVIISPHAQLYRDVIVALALPEVEGSLGDFGATDVKFKFKTDGDLIDLLVAEAEEADIRVLKVDHEARRRYNVRTSLDHGMLVPLYFLRQAGLQTPLVPLAMGVQPLEQLYRFGQAIARACKRSGKRVALIASGDLSHRLTADAPAGFNPRGAEFDRELMAALRDGDAARIVTIDKELTGCAGECGLRPVVELLGALDGLKLDIEVLSYEGPYGVGYGVATLIPRGADPQREYLARIADRRRAEVAARRRGESPLVSLARRSLEHFVATGGVVEIPPDFPTEFTSRAAGVFVTLKKDGELRGCIGTIEPVRDNIAQEIVSNAISAGSADPRFDPVEPEELDDLVYSVDVLGTPEPIDSIADLDPDRYGVIVSKGSRSGLLLPHLEGIHDAREQYTIACQKGGIKPGEAGIKLERFEVVRFH